MSENLNSQNDFYFEKDGLLKQKISFPLVVAETEGEVKDAIDEFNAVDVLATVKKQRSVRKKRCTYGKSKLNKFRAELVKLKDAGASYVDMQFWLRKEKRIKIDPSNICRFLNKDLPIPMQEN